MTLSPPPPNGIRMWLAATSLIAALAVATAAPAVAQVDWATVFDGEAGQVHCPPGKTHHTGTSFVTVRGTVKADRADVGLNASLDIGTIRTPFSALATQTSVPVNVGVYRGQTARAVDQIGTVTADTPLASFTWTFGGLQANTRHAGDLIAGNNNNNIILTACFRTGETSMDLSRSLGYRDDINHGNWAGGCFAFADLKGPNHRKRSMPACAEPATVPASGRGPMPMTATNTSATPATGPRWAAPRTDWRLGRDDRRTERERRLQLWKWDIFKTSPLRHNGDDHMSFSSVRDNLMQARF